MMDGTVLLPERLGRRMSIGPFVDPRDFLRFLLAVSFGIVPATLLGWWAWVPFLAAGALLTLFSVQEETLWVLVARRLRYLGRALRRVEGVGSAVPSGVGTAGPAGPVGVWEHEPWRISGRTSGDLLAQSEDLLRALAPVGGEVVLVRSPCPWDVEPFLPPEPPGPDLRPKLRSSYATLLRRAVEGRHRTRIFLRVPGTPRSNELSTLSELHNFLRRNGWERRARVPEPSLGERSPPERRSGAGR